MKQRSPSEKDSEETSTLLVNKSISSQKPAETFLSFGRYEIWYYKNLIVMALAFVFIYSAFTPLQSLQSSIHKKNGLGTVAIGAMYSVTVIFCTCSPFIVRLLTVRGTLLISWGFFLAFVVSNLYPRFYTLVPTAALLGLCSGPLWTAQGTYVAALATNFADAFGKEVNTCINIFNGIFFFIVQTTHIWGNAISSVILDKHKGKYSSRFHCGNKYCPRDAFQVEKDRTQMDGAMIQSVNILIVIYIILTLVGVVITYFFFDDTTYPPFENRPHFHERKSSLFQQLFAVKNISKDINIILLIPLFFYTGLQGTMIYGDYPVAFTSCVLGIDHIGFSLISYGFFDAVACLMIGPLFKFLSQTVIFFIAIILNSILLVFMLCWNAMDGPVELFFIIPGLWGISDGIWQANTTAFIALLFPKRMEAAFASFRLWQALGLSIGFFYSSFLCMTTKLFINLGALILTVILFIVLECKYIIDNDREMLLIAESDVKVSEQ